MFAALGIGGWTVPTQRCCDASQGVAGEAERVVAWAGAGALAAASQSLLRAASRARRPASLPVRCSSPPAYRHAAGPCPTGPLTLGGNGAEESLLPGKLLSCKSCIAGSLGQLSAGLQFDHLGRTGRPGCAALRRPSQYRRHPETPLACASRKSGIRLRLWSGLAASGTGSCRRSDPGIPLRGGAGRRLERWRTPSRAPACDPADRIPKSGSHANSLGRNR